MTKTQVRKQALENRDAMDAIWRQQASMEIHSRIVQSKEYREADKILSYASFRSEVDTQELNQRIIEDGKRLYLPKTYPREHKMIFFPVRDLANLQPGYQGIMEPEESETEIFQDFGDGKYQHILMLMPGAAFDESGNRMGYGGGYYDRYLARKESYVVTLFLAFEEQGVEEVPTEFYDKKPDGIVTQTRWIQINK